MSVYLFVLFAVVVRLGVALRWIDQPFAFMPVAAALLFFGARASRRQLWVPLAAFAATDVALNLFVYQFPLSLLMLASIAWYAGVLMLGTLLTRNESTGRLAGASLAASVSFFLVTNAAAWLWDPMYVKSFEGLMSSYYMGLPFFRHALAGDLFYTAAFFGLAAVVEGARQTAPNRIRA